jgi:hypothetical protein
MLQVVVGHSNDPDSRYAVAEVLEQCRKSLVGNQPKAGILFAAIDFDHALILDEINCAFPGIILIGGTTDGEVSSILEFQQDSLSLMLFCSDDIEITAGIGRGVSKDAIAAANETVKMAKANVTKEPKFCLTFPESLTASGVTILQGLQQAFETQLPIFGGTTADQLQLRQTYQFFNTEVTSDTVPILLFSGNLSFSHGVASGWQPIGKAGKVTKVVKNVIYEIDGQPALDFYRHYLGELPPSTEYPLAVFDEDSENFYLRSTPGNFDPDSGSITFFADIPENTTVQITQAMHNDVLAAAEDSMLQALASYPGKEPVAALFFSCSARRQILGSRTKEEYLRLKEHIPASTQCCGFYTYGEIAPLHTNGKSLFHNETFVTLLLEGDS